VHQDKRRPHSQHPGKRHAEPDRLLDMIIRSLTPWHWLRDTAARPPRPASLRVPPGRYTAGHRLPSYTLGSWILHGRVSDGMSNVTRRSQVLGRMLRPSPRALPS
jgi:hypothetical protein